MEEIKKDLPSVQNREVNVVATLGSGSGNTDEQKERYELRFVLHKLIKAVGSGKDVKNAVEEAEYILDKYYRTEDTVRNNP